MEITLNQQQKKNEIKMTHTAITILLLPYLFFHNHKTQNVYGYCYYCLWLLSSFHNKKYPYRTPIYASKSEVRQFRVVTSSRFHLMFNYFSWWTTFPVILLDKKEKESSKTSRCNGCAQSIKLLRLLYGIQMAKPTIVLVKKRLF